MKKYIHIMIYSLFISLLFLLSCTQEIEQEDVVKEDIEPVNEEITKEAISEEDTTVVEEVTEGEIQKVGGDEVIEDDGKEFTDQDNETNWLCSDVTSDGKFDYPYGVAVGTNGYVYVSDGNNHRIQMFTNSGEFKAKWGSSGVDDGQFNNPSGIATDPDGNVYVADSGNNRIQKFSSTGHFITKWGVLGWDDGQFENPVDVTVDKHGNVYVADSGNRRIQKFTSNGAATPDYVLIEKWKI